MDKIRIRNLRSLKDTGEVELKPLTLLVGKNSSGKSTFLRVFPLFKQTLETNTNEPILWYSSRYVDFGSFNESLNKLAKKEDTNDKFISFDFEFSLSKDIVNRETRLNNRLFYYRDLKNFDNSQINEGNTQFRVSIDTSKKHLNKITIQLEDHHLEITITKDDKINKCVLTINGEILTNNLQVEYSKDYSHLLPKLFADKDLLSSDEYFKSKLFTILQSMSHAATKDETIDDFITGIRFGNSEDFMKSLKEQSTTANILLEKIRALDPKSEILKEILNNYLGMQINRFISICNNYIEQYFSSVNYIAPLRASAERYYRIQGLSVDDIDPQGENIPMIFHNMSFQEKYEYNIWLLGNFGFQITSNFEGGHSSISIKYNNGQEVNLADTGFGYSQILPITIVLWQISKKQEKEENSLYMFLNPKYKFFNIVIEQPELHLHPSLQAKLIDTFAKIIVLCKAREIDVKIIIETHSETMINRVGYLIAKKIESFNKDLVNVVIFENDEVFDTKLETTGYSEKGYLIKWPLGFFEPEGI
ncbi:AAA family ATPase [Peribacillus sp. FSL E2-0159]|uniref:AAA family ATPase n=1 Tax=Peribacillus sp. FSL E2-0159 TaxID=2975289 RepID=UPI00315B1816